MRKYRYGNPNQHSFFRKYGNWIYFIATWNLFGVVLWKALGAQKRKDDAEWDSKSATDKYLTLTGLNERAKRVQIGAKQTETTDGVTDSQETAQQ